MRFRDVPFHQAHTRSIPCLGYAHHWNILLEVRRFDWTLDEGKSISRTHANRQRFANGQWPESEIVIAADGDDYGGSPGWRYHEDNDTGALLV